MRLAKAPCDINIGTVVRELENLEGSVDCMGGKGKCALAGGCGLTPVLSGALGAFLDHLDGFSLAGIVSDRDAAIAKLFA